MVATAPVHAHENDALAFFGSVVVASGVGYGCYKLYEYFAFNNAQSTLKTDSKTSVTMDGLIQNIALDEQHLIQQYLQHKDAFKSFCKKTAHEVATLERIQQTTEAAIVRWGCKNGAEDFIARAHSFAAVNQQRLNYAKRVLSFLYQVEALLELAYMLQEEQFFSLRQIIHAASLNQLHESLVRAHCTQSAWPLRECWNTIQARKSNYEKYLQIIDVTTLQTAYGHALMRQAADVVHCYATAQAIIAGFPEYTKEVRLQKEFELKEEQTRQLRIQAEAAERAAQAHERQARAQEQQNRLNKEKELAECRSELSEIKRKIDQGDSNYYLKQRRNQLQERIAQLKRQLGYEQTFLDVVVNLAIDRD